MRNEEWVISVGWQKRGEGVIGFIPRDLEHNGRKYC